MALEPLAYASEGWGTCYLDNVAELWPEGHPRRWIAPFGVGVVAYDQFPASSPIRLLYEWPPLKAFLEEVLGRGTLYPYADPLGALNLAVMTDSDQLQWHFDMTDFVVSLALRPAAEGGDFEVVPRVRTSVDERYDDVAEVLEGRSADVEVLPMRPGTLLVFEGRNSVHRVTPIHGDVARLVALLAYDTEPGTRGSEGLSRSRYGRLA